MAVMEVEVEVVEVVVVVVIKERILGVADIVRSL